MNQEMNNMKEQMKKNIVESEENESTKEKIHSEN